MVLARKSFHREAVVGPQPNPDVWPLHVSMLLIQWLQQPGFYADDRWKPRSWLEEEDVLVGHPGYLAGRGPVWVMENDNTTGKAAWEILE